MNQNGAYCLCDRATNGVYDPLPWQPVSALDPVKQVTEKELQVDLNRITQHLQDTQKVDWQMRVKAMQRLQELAPFLQQHLSKLVNPLKAQVHDLRSTSAREAGVTI